MFFLFEVQPFWYSPTQNKGSRTIGRKAHVVDSITWCSWENSLGTSQATLWQPCFPGITPRAHVWERILSSVGSELDLVCGVFFFWSEYIVALSYNYSFIFSPTNIMRLLNVVILRTKLHIYLNFSTWTFKKAVYTCFLKKCKENQNINSKK